MLKVTAVIDKPVQVPELQRMVEDKRTNMPQTVADILAPFYLDMGKLTVVHPTDNDPVLVSEKMGVVAIWLNI